MSTHTCDGYENYDDKELLNEGEEDQMEVEGFKKCLPYQILSWIGIILSFGLLGLIYFWFPRIHLWCTHKRCSLSKADTVLITDRFEKNKEYYVKNVYHEVIFENSNLVRNHAYTNQSYGSDKSLADDFDMKFNSLRVLFSTGYSTEISEYRLFIVKKLRYIWVEEKGKFLKLSGLGAGLTHSQLHEYKRLTPHLQQHLQKLFGRNEILINVQSYLTLLFIEIASPYYFFQLFSVVVWIVDDYFYYTYAIIFVSISSIAITVIQTHRAQLSLRKTVQASEAIKANILTSDGRSIESKCIDLVPGDRIVIPDNEEYTLPCDALILSGSCIVRESMLTGESVPLTKTALPVSNEDYIEKESSNHLLFCGTKVIQTRRDQGMHVQALVLRTGYTTAKGDLVRAILYPPPVDYEFEQSIYSFINRSAIGAFVLAIGVAVWLGIKGVQGLQVFTKSFELVTMVIPAAIPGSLTLSKVYAIRRFKKKNIACINPKVINVAGSANCVCFDKTGTITEDGLDVWGVVPVENCEFQGANNSPKTLRNDHLKYALATCHSLSISNDKIIGDPLDSKMFESTGWNYEDSYEDSTGLSKYNTPRVFPNILDKHKLTIFLLHQNLFMSNLQRMSIITQRCGNDFMDLYCKGSPEMIASLSKENSVPKNLEEILKSYTIKGYRVLALGSRQLNNYPLDLLKKKPRNELEQDLQFLGLLILENKVKSESRPTIGLLKKGQFKVTMITENVRLYLLMSN